MLVEGTIIQRRGIKAGGSGAGVATRGICSCRGVFLRCEVAGAMQHSRLQIWRGQVSLQHVPGTQAHRFAHQSIHTCRSRRNRADQRAG